MFTTGFLKGFKLQLKASHNIKSEIHNIDWASLNIDLQKCLYQIENA